MMENQLKRLARLLMAQYLLFWLLPIGIMVAGECFDTLVGDCAGEVGTAYLLDTIAILLAAVCVPLALKLFGRRMKTIDSQPLPAALRSYLRWCGLRLFLLEIPAIFGVTAYYLTLDNTGILCGFIGLTASLFCVPDRKRTLRELHLAEPDDD
jgi:hypothetical protein